MHSLGVFVRRRPRTAAAIAFGTCTAAVTHFAWIPDARMSGVAPMLTLAAGAAHALAAFVTGRRLIDPTRTRNVAEACLIGAGTSLLAVVLFAPWFALWVSAGNVQPQGPLSYIVLALLIAVFSFMAIGWALLLVSMGVAWGLYRLAVAPVAAARGGV